MTQATTSALNVTSRVPSHQQRQGTTSKSLMFNSPFVKKQQQRRRVATQKLHFEELVCPRVTTLVWCASNCEKEVQDELSKQMHQMYDVLEFTPPKMCFENHLIKQAENEERRYKKYVEECSLFVQNQVEEETLASIKGEYFVVEDIVPPEREVSFEDTLILQSDSVEQISTKNSIVEPSFKSKPRRRLNSSVTPPGGGNNGPPKSFGGNNGGDFGQYFEIVSVLLFFYFLIVYLKKIVKVLWSRFFATRHSQDFVEPSWK